ncbi:MAG: hypothetical protein P8M30_14465 [Planctomycetaceae bacterium]|jgi:hypothetical protein|nr:hypothetical protein [Planctomycetaceae bacterium]MDG2390509.1 hypothetical protein [Planctomycetaceae bacterium]
MTTTRDDILEAAIKLSDADRLVIANRLLETLEHDIPGAKVDDPELLELLEKRSGQWEHSLSWDELRKQLEANE